MQVSSMKEGWRWCRAAPLEEGLRTLAALLAQGPGGMAAVV